MKKLTVNVGSGYDILIEGGIIFDCGKYIKQISDAKKVMVITDSDIYPLYVDTVRASLRREGFWDCLHIFEAGEPSKTPETVISMVEAFAQAGLTRGDLVIALGGGVCGDMVGFAAAIYLRGIDFVQIPTTLLAQVDSSVGGKTAVNLPEGKNLCGAFHQPRLVLIDPHVLSSLEPEYFADGMGEVIKTACIRSRALFEMLEKHDTESIEDIIEDVIFKCVGIKARIVENDEKEKGERALLNFGHTPGHAIEKLHNFTVSHGEAVGMGMVIMCLAGENNMITKFGCANRIEALLKQYGLKTKDSHSLKEIVEAMDSDKKRTGTGINFVLLKDIGESFVHFIEDDGIAAFFGVDDE